MRDERIRLQDSPMEGGWRTRGDCGRSSARTRDLVLVSLLAVGMLAFGWLGFLASDDWIYAQAAERWLQLGPHLGSSHHALRLPVVLPIARSFALFGVSEFSLVLPTLVFFAALTILTYSFLAATLDRFAALAAVILLVTCPLFAVTATVASADIAELCFLVSSIWLFHRATESEHRSALLFGAGVAAGLAFTTRETAGVLVIYYGLLFLARYRLPRRRYWIVAAGFAAIVCTETILLGLVTGDPFYRFRIDIHAARLPSIEGTGNLEIDPLVDPFLAILLNQEFALLFFAAIPLGCWIVLDRSAPERSRTIARLLGGLGVIWFVAIGYGPLAERSPRYFSVTAYVGVILVAMWHASIGRRMPRLAFVVAAGLVLSNLLGVYLENRDPLFGERRLAERVAQESEPVYTDPETARRVTFFLTQAGLLGRVQGVPPPTGSLYFYNSKRAARGWNVPEPFDPRAYAPQPSWGVVWHAEPKRKLSGDVAESLGLGRILPAWIFLKLTEPNPAVVLYRTADREAAAHPERTTSRSDCRGRRTKADYDVLRRRTRAYAPIATRRTMIAINPFREVVGAPIASGVHSPACPGLSQLTFAPVQGSLQQTPSAQKSPGTHCDVSVQFPPMDARVLVATGD